MKFKNGVTVRITNKDSMKYGKLGLANKINYESYPQFKEHPYAVFFEDQTHLYFNREDFEIVDEEFTVK